MANYTLKPDRFSSHAQIAALLWKQAKNYAKNPYVVLDVGCANGFLRHFLPAPYFYLIGVERDDECIVQLRQHYDEVYQADLTPELVLSLSRKPQVVVLADVLEHLPYPASALTNLLRNHVVPGTHVIISLPNVANLSVRLSLLLGRFEYSDRGILDRTHLRFFTLQSFRRLCYECEIAFQSLSVTPVPLPLIHPLFNEGQLLFPLYALNAYLANVWKTLLAYQFILDGVYKP
jgi:SAM-dependent methyltransferase